MLSKLMLLNNFILFALSQASLDQPTQTLVVHHHGASSAENKLLGAGDGTAAAEGIDSGGSERQRLQGLVLQFNQKLHALFEQNEKLSELKNTQQTSIHRAFATIMNQQQGCRAPSSACLLISLPTIRAPRAKWTGSTAINEVIAAVGATSSTLQANGHSAVNNNSASDIQKRNMFTLS